MKLVTVLALCLCALVALTAAGQLSAQTSTMGTGATTTLAPGSTVTTTTSPLAPTTISSPSALPIAAATGTGTTAAVLNVVEITRLVPAGTTAVTAFTVPAGQTLIVTDVVLTNTGTAGACGAALNRAGGSATTPSATFTTPPTSTTTTNTGTTTPTLAGTVTQTDSSVTGPLCVAPLTTTPLNLSTGIEFGPGQTVQLVNAPSSTPASGTAATAGAVGFHLRGVLVASSS